MRIILSEFSNKLAKGASLVWQKLRPAREIDPQPESMKSLVRDAIIVDQFTKESYIWRIITEQAARYREYLLENMANQIKFGKITTEQAAMLGAQISGFSEFFTGLREFVQSAERASQKLNMVDGVNRQHKEELALRG